MSLVSLAIGILLGYAIWGTRTAQAPTDHSSMTMEESMGSMTDSLKGRTGDAFDQAFLQEMVVHHEGAVTMAQQVLTTSSRPELRKLAEDIVTAQTMEIQMMRDWEEQWFPRTGMKH